MLLDHEYNEKLCSNPRKYRKDGCKGKCSKAGYTRERGPIGKRGKDGKCGERGPKDPNAIYVPSVKYYEPLSKIFIEIITVMIEKVPFYCISKLISHIMEKHSF